MARVVVPLDGSDLAAAILPDAVHLAGPDGEIILVHEARVAPYPGLRYEDEQRREIESSDAYLSRVAEELTVTGVKVDTQTMIFGDAALAIDEAARVFGADMIAVATHGRGTVGRLLHGSVAWRALAHSQVPVLVRHIRLDADQTVSVATEKERVLLPLDGSVFAERALPLACRLAGAWNAELLLVRVVPTATVISGGFGTSTTVYDDTELMVKEAERYLEEVAASIPLPVRTMVVLGSPAGALVNVAKNHGISSVVMASHGRTGPSRVILGSVADALIHLLDEPIIVVPALAARVPVERQVRSITPRLIQAAGA